MKSECSHNASTQYQAHTHGRNRSRKHRGCSNHSCCMYMIPARVVYTHCNTPPIPCMHHWLLFSSSLSADFGFTTSMIQGGNVVRLLVSYRQTFGSYIERQQSASSNILPYHPISCLTFHFSLSISPPLFSHSIQLPGNSPILPANPPCAANLAAARLRTPALQ